jgi:D-glycero-D-manno-heptose 1,7-bisphosphate phosphatase
VFLDRDGTLNRGVVIAGRPFPPQTLSALEILPGVEHALARLRRAGFLNIVVTNQPDVGAGRQERDVVEAINNYLCAKLAIDDMWTCYEPDSDTNKNYKPKPGMLLEAAEKHGIDLSCSFMIGDRWRDIGAGKAAGCYTFFIDYGYREAQPYTPDATVDSVAEAAAVILANTPMLITLESTQ